MRIANFFLLAALLSFAPLKIRAAGQPIVVSVQDADRENLREFISAPFRGFLRFYRRFLRTGKAPTCPMVPSDSAYALEAVHRHGLAWGSAMASDRLMRCGQDLEQYKTVVIGGKLYYHDPVAL